MSKSWFFTDYIFVRKLPFYVKILLFYTHKFSWKKRASCSSFRPFDKPIYRRQAVFYSMVRTLLNCSFRALLKLYVIRYPASHVHVHVPGRVPFIVGLLNSFVNSLKALKIYVLFFSFIISSCFPCHSIFQDLLIVECEEGTGSNFICYAYRPKSHTAVTAY